MPLVQINGDRQVTTAEIPRILQTIRAKESGGNYTAHSRSSTASGAYQMIDSTWRSWGSYVPGAQQYAHAADAPAALQDAVASAAVGRILASHGYWLSSVPINWYLPAAWDKPVIANQIPPGGNSVTVAQYAQSWVNYFLGSNAPPSSNTGGSGSGTGASGPSSAGGIGGLPTWIFGPAGEILGKIPGIGDFPLFGPLGSTAGTVADFFAFFIDPKNWIRILKILGGTVAIFVGLIMLGKQMGVGIPPVVKNAVKAAAVA